MRVVNFYYNEDPSNIQYGMIAEEMAQILPEIVLRDNDEEDGLPRAIQYHLIQPLMIKELQTHETRLDEMPAYLVNTIANQPIALNGATITEMSSRGLRVNSELSHLQFVLEGKTVSFHIPPLTISSISGTSNLINIFSENNPLPISFIPNEAIDFPCIVMESGVRLLGLISINNNLVTLSKIDGTAIKTPFTTKDIEIKYIIK